METKKYGKLPPPKNDVIAYNKKRRELYLEGIDYLFGKNGQDKNVKKAYHLIKQSADMNYAYAKNAIGSFYLTGQIVDRDFAKAFRIYIKMANRLNPKAAYNLGKIYKDGLHVPQDLEKAKYYYNKSVAYAVREYLQGEELGLRFLKEAFRFSEEKINEVFEIYHNNPICEFCHGLVPVENDFAYFRLNIRWIRKTLFNTDDSINFSRGEPVLKNGYCWALCEHLYVDPIRQALKDNIISQAEVALLHERDDMMAAIKIFIKSELN